MKPGGLSAQSSLPAHQRSCAPMPRRWDRDFQPTLPGGNGETEKLRTFGEHMLDRRITPRETRTRDRRLADKARRAARRAAR